jgi:hypothetical protein
LIDLGETIVTDAFGSASGHESAEQIEAAIHRLATLLQSPAPEHRPVIRS